MIQTRSSMPGLLRVTGVDKYAHMLKRATAWDRWQERNPLLSTGAYFVPGVSSAMSLGDSVSAFSKGKILSGLGHLGWAALGLIPGSTVLRGAGRSAKVVNRAARLNKARKLATRTTRLGRNVVRARHISGVPSRAVINAAGRLVPASQARRMTTAGRGMVRLSGNKAVKTLGASAIPLHLASWASGEGTPKAAPAVYNAPQTVPAAQQGWGALKGMVAPYMTPTPKPTYFGNFAKVAMSNPTVGDFINAISSDMSLDTFKRNNLLSQARSASRGIPSSAPVSRMVSGIGGGALGYLVSKYFGAGALRSTVGAAVGFGVGRMADKHIFNRDDPFKRNGSLFRGYRGL